MAAAKKPAPVEVDGISFTPAVDAGDDFGVAVAARVLTGDEGTASEKVAALDELATLLFGADKRRVLAELRAKNGGRIPHRTMGEFIGRAMQASRELKNS